MTYLTHRSNKEYHSPFLIPSWALKTFNISSAVIKRTLLVLLFFPLFYLVPIPVVDPVYVLTLYVIPIMIVIAIVLIVTCIIKWIIYGKIDKMKGTDSQDNIKMLCKHCGNQIDTDSEYCRYCGKKVEQWQVSRKAKTHSVAEEFNVRYTFKPNTKIFDFGI